MVCVGLCDALFENVIIDKMPIQTWVYDMWLKIEIRTGNIETMLFKLLKNTFAEGIIGNMNKWSQLLVA